MLKIPAKKDLAILIGNVLEHYDTCLYGLIAPVIAPHFFPHPDPIVQLILAYSLLGTSLIAKPLGVILFSLLAKKKGAYYSLSLSLMGVAALTAAIGLLPTYASIGIYAPLSLIVVRVIRGIFAAGEGIIAKLYILEDKELAQKIKISSWYQSSSVLGIILASAISSLISAHYPNYWRIPFLLGALSGLMGVYIRAQFKQLITPLPDSTLSARLVIKTYPLAIVKIAIVVGFSYVTYAFAFIIPNTLVPLITDISFATMLALNTKLLIIDMFLIPIIGKLTAHYPPARIMQIATCALTLLSLPLFAYAKDATLGYIVVLRFIVILFGILYLCPLNVWLEQFAGRNKYLLVGLGSALGSNIGRFAPAITLLLWKYTNSALTTGCYLLITALISLIVLSLPMKKIKS